MRPFISTVFAVLLGLASSSAAEMPGKGASFPEWTLSDHRGNEVSSSDLAGTTYVMWFYPKAMTPGCTVEGNAFRDRYPSFAERRVKVFGVSFDTPAANAKFVDEQNFPFALLSDEKKELGKAVGATRPLIGYARRISFLIGPDGRILESYEDVDPATHADQVLRDIEAASGK